MFRFENESFLYLFILLGILIALYVILQFADRKRLRQFCDEKLLKKLMGGHSPVMYHLKSAIAMLAFACLIFAAANPQTAGKLEKNKRQGVDIVFCLDISNSMLAQDIQPNRLSACKMSMSRFINRLNGDRVGVVLFAGTSFVQLPVTTDYAAAKMFISQIKPDLIPTQGTNLSEALTTADYALIPDDKRETQVKTKNEKPTSKVVVLVSDGEDHFPEAIETAKVLHEDGIVVHTIGIGSLNGTTIPTSKGVKKDRDGNTVITHLNEQILKDIAENAGGVYVHAQNTTAGFDAILNEIDRMEKSDIEDVSFSNFNSWFQYPLALGLLLLLVEGFLFTSRPKWSNWMADVRKKIAKTHTAAIFIVCILTCCISCNRNKTHESRIQQANAEFRQGDSLRGQDLLTSNDSLAEADTTGFSHYLKALSGYEEADSTEAINQVRACFNQVDARYRLHQYDTIPHIVDSLLAGHPDKLTAAKFYYNKGNALMKQGNYSQACDAFKEALRRNPKDFDAKYNLVYAQKMKNNGKNGSGKGGGQNQQQNQQQQGGGNNNKQNQDKQDQQQQQNGGQQSQGGNQQQQQGSSAATLRLLDALQQNEKGTQDKVQRAKSNEQAPKSKKQKQEKDW